MNYIINKFKVFLAKLQKSHINEYTASCVYFTLLAFIPLIMLILTITKYIGISQSDLFFLMEKLGSNNIINEGILGVIKEVYSKSIGTITISAIFVLWSAEKGFFALCKGLNSAYERPQKNRFIFFRIRAIICTIIFILLVVTTLILLVFGNRINVMLEEKFNIGSVLINFILRSKILISFILFLVFILMYKFIPKHNYKLKYQIPGAVFAMAFCNIVSIFYAIYIKIFSGFSIMYGSLTTVVLAMMWVYACMYSILFGAIINKFLIGEKLNKNVKK